MKRLQLNNVLRSRKNTWQNYNTLRISVPTFSRHCLWPPRYTLTKLGRAPCLWLRRRSQNSSASRDGLPRSASVPVPSRTWKARSRISCSWTRRINPAGTIAFGLASSNGIGGSSLEKKKKKNAIRTTVSYFHPTKVGADRITITSLPAKMLPWFQHERESSLILAWIRKIVPQKPTIHMWHTQRWVYTSHVIFHTWDQSDCRGMVRAKRTDGS